MDGLVHRPVPDPPARWFQLSSIARLSVPSITTYTSMLKVQVQNSTIYEMTSKIVEAFPINHAPNCAFWKRSHAQLARVGGNCPPHEFKRARQAMRASPIIYADSFGTCIPYGNPRRDIHRNSWAANFANVVGHIDNIFGHGIIDRVNLVILSGLDEQVFGRAAERIEHICGGRRLHYVRVRFFGSRRSNNDLDNRLTANATDLLSQVYQQFMKA